MEPKLGIELGPEYCQECGKLRIDCVDCLNEKITALKSDLAVLEKQKEFLNVELNKSRKELARMMAALESIRKYSPHENHDDMFCARCTAEALRSSEVKG